MLDIDKVLQTARNLKSEDAENAEYDRALVELSADLLGQGSEASRVHIAEALDIDMDYIYPGWSEFLNTR